MAYELRVSPTSEWRPISKTDANRRAVCHYYREQLFALFGLVDRGMILECNGHGQVRRKPGRWSNKQVAKFSSITKGRLVIIQTITGERQSMRAVKQVSAEVWKLTEGEAVLWNIVDVRGTRGGRCTKSRKARKQKARKQRASVVSALDSLDVLNTL